MRPRMWEYTVSGTRGSHAAPIAVEVFLMVARSSESRQSSSGVVGGIAADHASSALPAVVISLVASISCLLRRGEELRRRNDEALGVGASGRDRDQSLHRSLESVQLARALRLRR